MIFIYCSWVSTRWQWSVDWYKNRERKAIYKWRNSTKTVQKHRIHKIENKHKKIFEKHKSIN